MIRVAIFDDNPERLLSLISLFSISENINCVGTFLNCNNLELNLECKPDVILMDIRMPGIDGIEATKKIKHLYPNIKVLIQTVSDDSNNIFLSIKAGALGYILKSSPIEKIISCIVAVHEGLVIMSPSVAISVNNSFSSINPSDSHLFEKLTEREMEILLLLTEGLSYKLIAAKIGTSYHTVNSHIKKIYEKLRINSLAEAISMTFKNRLL